MIPYIGGKNNLSKWIISNFPKNYQELTYIEPFGGAGWVLFKKEKSVVEVYNDVNADLVNLFLQIRDNYKQFKRKALWTLNSRDMFKIAKAKFKHRKFEDDVDRAVQYAIIRVQSFSGSGNSWGYSKTDKRARWKSFVKRIIKIRKRLETVQIENLDFRQIIEKYDSKTSLFYIDPPYIGKEHYYEASFTEKDHTELAKMLQQIKGKFVLSYYPHPLVDKYYKNFNIQTKQVSKSSYGITVNSKQKIRPKGTELLIKNF